MAYFSFNPFGTKSVIVRFNCDVCESQVESEEIFVPSPNYMADKASDSQVEEEGYGVCPNCDKQFDVDVYVTYAGGDGHVNDLPDDYDIFVDEVDEPYYDEYYEAVSANTEFWETFNIELDNIIELSKQEIQDAKLQAIFLRQLYVSVIGVLETYLSDAFINTTFSSKENLQNFFRTYPSFKKQNISVSSYFEFEAKVKTVAKKEMIDIIYHKLPNVSEMYKATLGIKFPRFGEIYKAINTRHHFVHRNGKDKDGKIVGIEVHDLIELVNKVRDFITTIDNDLKTRLSN